jgi:hypothetical protein
MDPRAVLLGTIGPSSNSVQARGHRLERWMLAGPALVSSCTGCTDGVAQADNVAPEQLDEAQRQALPQASNLYISLGPS